MFYSPWGQKVERGRHGSPHISKIRHWSDPGPILSFVCHHPPGWHQLLALFGSSFLCACSTLTSVFTRTSQCPTDSCRNASIPLDSSRFQQNGTGIHWNGLGFQWIPMDSRGIDSFLRNGTGIQIFWAFIKSCFEIQLHRINFYFLSYNIATLHHSIHMFC